MRRTRWAAVALLLGALGFGAAAGVIEAVARSSASAGEVAALGTPVLSVRRLPAVLGRPRAEAHLRAALAGWASTVPARACAVVVDSIGDVVLDLRGGEPFVPASSQKLLTATAALLALGPDAQVGTSTMREAVGQVLRESDDATAELLLEELARASSEPSASDGRAAALELLAGAGLDLTAVSLVDGSGHSLQNRVTCRLLVDVLRLPATAPVVDGLLAVAGESGTLADRFVGTSLVGHLRAKTGSLRGVAALAGVVEDRDGSFTFAYLVNAAAGERVDEPSVTGSQQRLAEILLEWPGAGGLAALGPLPLPPR